jgi:CRISPR system Cascade subunit CasD
MPTLLMRFVAPMQSWGTRSQFDDRDTEGEPSKSGVIGLVCAALGVVREDTERTLELAALRMGVRVDQPGRRLRDYHTARMSAKSGTVQTWRHYLSHAAFLVGLEGTNRELLVAAHEALKNPVFPLFLGRKSFVPSLPVWMPNGLRDESLEVAMKTYPGISRFDGTGQAGTQFILETDTPTGGVRFDQPISNFSERKFGIRYVQIGGL